MNAQQTAYEVVRKWEAINQPGYTSPACLDAKVKNDNFRRFTQNDDGTWSAWSKSGYMRRVFIGKHMYFTLDNDRLIPA